jgi:glycosyltransferase involved in cell wall biosynthesis
MSVPLYVEISPLLTRSITGIGRYIVRVLDELARMAPVRLLSYHRWDTVACCTRRWPRLYCGREIELTPENVPPRGTDVRTWRDKVLACRSRPLDTAAARDGAVVFSWSRWPGGPSFAREIGVVYDMSPLVLPHTVPRPLLESFAPYSERDIPQFDSVLTISQATKDDIAWLTDVDPRQVAVALPGPSQCVETHAYRGHCRRDPKKLLVVGPNHPRKNTQFLIDWFCQSEHLPAGAELCLAGPPCAKQFMPQIPARLPDGRRVRSLGTVSDAKLCRLYQEAGCTIYPTLYEGFGFPVLDSLLHGAPVLSSYNSSLIEFAGPGVFFFDPCDVESLDRAWRELQAQWPLDKDIRRDDLRQTCTWENVARTLLRLCA